MEAQVRELFGRYAEFFNHSLAGDVDDEGLSSLYAAEFIAASPAGIMAGKNDARFGKAMAQGYERYRAIGTKEMRLRDVTLLPIDEHHCVAKVAWRAIYEKAGQPDHPVDFDVHYFVQKLNGKPKVFGWVSGDEEALLKKEGIV
ncbi:nuclear transport factor 2 family protein [Aliihoeflea aestuarii]|jgi:hypothetical protein|uniref:nuclear transport factor 2 family protein n=1 Tax=Aliihoeflea aestuarii TaxID=453840 RepID=UPI002092E344|nr:nuclear transport factor 2 family protein [Aliihoeflea aestuarii]MCO6391433.1 nuclear transport factor 2 family protein [Aliihoeflea aestuarii]